MRPVKMTREEFEQVRGYEPSKTRGSYEDYEQLFEKDLASYNARAVTLADMDAIIEKMLFKETL